MISQVVHWKTYNFFCQLFLSIQMLFRVSYFIVSYKSLDFCHLIYFWWNGEWIDLRLIVTNSFSNLIMIYFFIVGYNCTMLAIAYHVIKILVWNQPLWIGTKKKRNQILVISGNNKHNSKKNQNQYITQNILFVTSFSL
jgi:hypothetical protein